MSLATAAARLDPAIRPGSGDSTPRRSSVGAFLGLFCLTMIGATGAAIVLRPKPASAGIALVALLIGIGVAATRGPRPMGTARGLVLFTLGSFSYLFVFVFVLDSLSAYLLRQRISFPIALALMLAILGGWLLTPVFIVALVTRGRHRRAAADGFTLDVAPRLIGISLGVAFTILGLALFFTVVLLSPGMSWRAVNGVLMTLALPAVLRPLWILSYSALLTRWQVAEPAVLRQQLDELRDLAMFEFDRVMCLRASFGDGMSCFVILGSSRSTLVMCEQIPGRLTREQLKAVLAHEAAHVVLNHGNRKLAWGALGAATFIAGSIAGQIAVSGLIPWSFGFVRVLIVILPLTVLRGLYERFVTRRHEAEADAFATRLVGASAMLGALTALRGPTAVEPPIHNRWTTHGTWQERVVRIRHVAGETDDEA